MHRLLFHVILEQGKLNGRIGFEFIALLPQIQLDGCDIDSLRRNEFDDHFKRIRRKPIQHNLALIETIRDEILLRYRLRQMVIDARRNRIRYPRDLTSACLSLHRLHPPHRSCSCSSARQPIQGIATTAFSIRSEIFHFFDHMEFCLIWISSGQRPMPTIVHTAIRVRLRLRQLLHECL